MTGRGVDQIMPHSVDPAIQEPVVQSALDYLSMVEQVSGNIAKPVSFDYIWGSALGILQQFQPDLKIINLETAVTCSDERADKLINYRMHPANAAFLSAAGIDCCVLSNNHTLDWGVTGLRESLTTIRGVCSTAGAGENLNQAREPAVLAVGNSRVLVFSAGSQDSGITGDWSATGDGPGIWYLEDLAERTADDIVQHITQWREPGDIVVFSIHWGANWVKRIPRRHRQFAHRLIDSGQVDVIHGHSSHHPLGLEVYKGRLVMYGCGDFLNDYEGILRYRKHRHDLCLMYFVDLATDGSLATLTMVPMQIKGMSLRRAEVSDAHLLRRKVSRLSPGFLTRVKMDSAGHLQLHW